MRVRVPCGRLMTTTEAAAILGITPHTLRQQIAKGKLVARKVGRDYQIRPAEVERYRLEHLRGDTP
jgi:excisionase family DNA binding protein